MVAGLQQGSWDIISYLAKTSFHSLDSIMLQCVHVFQNSFIYILKQLHSLVSVKHKYGKYPSIVICKGF